MSGFGHIRTINVPRKIAEETQRFLQTAGRRHEEGLALWVGAATDETFDVVRLLIPRQRAIQRPDGICAVVDSAELHRINVELYESGLRLIAQIHSHPTDAFHSDTDDEHAIANTIGCVSIVVPDFGAGPFNFANDAVYRLNAKGQWEELDHADVSALIKLV